MIKRIKEFPKKPVFFSQWEDAWRITDTLELLEFVKSNNQIILGGDILNGLLDHTYDNWYYIPDESEDMEYNVEKSFTVAEQYISNYIKKMGESFYVILVVK